jgi:hypothetical protein
MNPMIRAMGALAAVAGTLGAFASEGRASEFCGSNATESQGGPAYQCKAYNDDDYPGLRAEVWFNRNGSSVGLDVVANEGGANYRTRMFAFCQDDETDEWTAAYDMELWSMSGDDLRTADHYYQCPRGSTVAEIHTWIDSLHDAFDSERIYSSLEDGATTCCTNANDGCGCE